MSEKSQKIIDLHAEYYDRAYTVANFNKCGFLDFPPFSLTYWSNIGSWNGIISTDGNKLIISRTAYFDDGKVLNTWEVKNLSIEKIDVRTFKTKIYFKQRVAGLTTKTTYELLWLVLLSTPLLLLPLFFINRQKLSMRLRNALGTRRAMEDSLRLLLKK